MDYSVDHIANATDVRTAMNQRDKIPAIKG